MGQVLAARIAERVLPLDADETRVLIALAILADDATGELPQYVSADLAAMFAERDDGRRPRESARPKRRRGARWRR
jgi:hypothetical protein